MSDEYSGVSGPGRPGLQESQSGLRDSLQMHAGCHQTRAHAIAREETETNLGFMVEPD